jgi:hypothetical protein
VIWLVWRRLRVPLLVVLGLVALVVATAVVGRFAWLAAARDLGAEHCLRGGFDGVCGSNEWYALRADHDEFRRLLVLAAIALPGVAGGVVGAVLFGPETARGTHVFALSQALPRTRWWGAGLLIAGLPVAAAVALVPLALTWSAQPFQRNTTSPLSSSVFLTSGVVPVAYALLAFCVAAAAGLLLRSPIGALGLAVGLHLAALVVTSLLVRPAYLPPETAYEALSAGRDDMPWATPDDALSVGDGFVDARGREVAPHEFTPVECDGGPFSDCLRAAGYTGLYSRFQPASRYWPFQAIESGLLLALAGGALGAGLRGLRRRVH